VLVKQGKKEALMKLYYSQTSPYSHKVRLFLRVKGLEAQVEEVLVNPFNEESSEEKDGLVKANPLGKVPTLVLDNGDALFDSPLICDYLERLSVEVQLIPTDETQRLNVLSWQALSDGMTDATYNLVMERRRPYKEQSQKWIANWSSEITRSLTHIESKINELNQLDKDVTLAHLSLASSISYLDFRLPDIHYESSCLQVSVCQNTINWYEKFKTRPYMQATRLFDFAG